MFTHENIRLRKLSESDLDQLFHLKQENWYGTHQITIINEEDQKRWFESLDNHPHAPRKLVLVAEDTLEFLDIGIFKLNIDWNNRVADVGWDVFEHFRGKGLGKRLVKAGVAYSFNLFDLRRLQCEILEHNGASMTCATLAGFKKEGYRREAVHRQGQYLGSYVMGLLKSDYTFASLSGTTPPVLQGGIFDVREAERVGA